MSLFNYSPTSRGPSADASATDRSLKTINIVLLGGDSVPVRRWRTT
jgi:hypothetical protein